MTTTPTASPELPDLDHMEALARAATPGPWCWWTSNSTLRLTGADGRDGGVLYGYARQGDGDVNCAPNNQAFIAAANPAAVLALIALARRAQPECEAPQAEPEPMNTQSSRQYLVEFMEKHFTDKTYHRYIRGEATRNALAGDFAWQMARALRMLERAPAASLSPLCGAQHAESGASDLDAFGAWKSYPLPDLNSDGHFDKDWLHREFVAFKAGRRAALAAQQAAAPGALAIEAAKLAPILRGMCEGGDVHGEGVDIYADDYIAGDGDTYVVRAAALLEQIAATSAPGTPKAPTNQDAKDAARYRVLRQHVLPHAVGIQMDRKPPARQPVEERIDLLCDIVTERRAAAQLDGDQEGSESNG